MEAETSSGKTSTDLSRERSESCSFVDIIENDGAEEEDLERQMGFGAPQMLEEMKRAAPPKAKKAETRISVILLDQGLFTVYKRLFIVSFALNVIAVVMAATGHFPYAEKEAALFSVGNITALVLCRSEAFLRIVFWAAVKVLGRSWVPLPVKTAATSFLQCLGGIHSGCGISSIMWLIYALLQILRHRDSTGAAIIAITAAILGLLFVSSMAAFPLVRHVHHNIFEEIHRFAGWAALALLWAFVILTTTYNPSKKSYQFHFTDLLKRQDFTFTVLITFLILLPWLTVRKVAVQVSTPSGQATLIKFPGGVNSGLLGRISRSPLSDWHAFGIISDGKDEHMMLAGAVGDFTRGLVSDPPKFLYTRCIHFAGLPYLVNMYEKVVVVATGSGICVFLSYMLQSSRAEVFFIWVAKELQRNYGDEIVGNVESYPSEKKIVHDTALLGRPNVAELTVRAVRDWEAQVVIVTSNPRGSRDVVRKCRGVGIPAFGPIWDS